MKPKFRGLPLILCLVTTLFSIWSLSASSSKEEKSKNQNDKSLKILTIGDSNGALPSGWVYQLKQIRSNDTIFNISVSGNTIGFNNNGRRSLNTLLNIESYLTAAYAKLGSIDRIIFMIGTNDCKSVYKDSLQVVAGNMRSVISETKRITGLREDNPVIYIVSPPPFGPDELVGEKYAGGMDRILKLNNALEDMAEEESVVFINSCQILRPVFMHLSSDGVHLNADGQRMIALIIQENLKY